MADEINVKRTERIPFHQPIKDVPEFTIKMIDVIKDSEPGCYRLDKVMQDVNMKYRYKQRVQSAIKHAKREGRAHIRGDYIYYEIYPEGYHRPGGKV